MAQCTATQLATVHANEFEGLEQHAILPIPARIQQRYDTVSGHIKFVRGGLTGEDDEFDLAVADGAEAAEVGGDAEPAAPRPAPRPPKTVINNLKVSAALGA